MDNALRQPWEPAAAGTRRQTERNGCLPLAACSGSPNILPQLQKIGFSYFSSGFMPNCVCITYKLPVEKRSPLSLRLRLFFEDQIRRQSHQRLVLAYPGLLVLFSLARFTRKSFMARI